MPHAAHGANPKNARRRGRRDNIALAMAWIGIIGAACFFFSITVLNLLRPDVSPVDGFVSDLANGQYGGAMTLSFMLHGFACAALGVGLARAITSTPSHRAATLLLMVGGVGVFGLAVFPTDPATAPRTTVGTIHLVVAGVAFSALVSSFMIFTHAFHHDSTWDRFHLSSRSIAIVAAIAFGVFISLTGLAHLADLDGAARVLGAAERATILSTLVWVFFTSLKLRDVSGMPTKESRTAARPVSTH